MTESKCLIQIAVLCWSAVFLSACGNEDETRNESQNGPCDGIDFASLCPANFRVTLESRSDEKCTDFDEPMPANDDAGVATSPPNTKFCIAEGKCTVI